MYDRMVLLNVMTKHVVHVDGVIICLWPAATIGPIVHLPDDM
jgi:hypothetical protein